jgi:ABC-type transporter Mla maintaining outer membrane lipid asymmetry ATPase subunit MlaF
VSVADPVIEVSGVVKHYQGLRPLRVQSLLVRAGERVAISGLDAVAAEVFVNLLNGAILPDEGEVRIFGRRTADIQTDTEWLAALDRFGIVTQRAVLLDGASIEQNLALPFSLEIDALGEEVLARTGALARTAGIAAEHMSRAAAVAPPHVRMRAHLAKSLALDPEVLLFEHATAGLPRDSVPAFARTVREVAAQRGLALVAVTEDTEFADVVAERAYTLRGGTGALVSASGWRRWLRM